jgi:hypothetical protein
MHANVFYRREKRVDTCSTGRCIFKHHDGCPHAGAFVLAAEVGSKKQKIRNADTGHMALMQHLNNGIGRRQWGSRVDTWR